MDTAVRLARLIGKQESYKMPGGAELRFTEVISIYAPAHPPPKDDHQAIQKAINANMSKVSFEEGALVGVAAPA